MDDEVKRFGQFFLLLDSNQPGERQAALEKIHAIRAAAPGLPAFGDIYRALEETAPRAEFEAVKAEVGKWMAAHDALSKENGALTQEVAALCAARQFMVKARRVAAVGCAAAVGMVGLTYAVISWAGSGDDPAARQEAALNAGMAAIAHNAAWGTEDSKPVVLSVAGTPYWIMLHPEIDEKTHTAANGKPVTRHCLRLFAVKATPDDGSYLTPPAKQDWFSHLAWPEVTKDCRDVSLAASRDVRSEFSPVVRNESSGDVNRPASSATIRKAVSATNWNEINQRLIPHLLDGIIPGKANP